MRSQQYERMQDSDPTFIIHILPLLRQHGRRPLSFKNFANFAFSFKIDLFKSRNEPGTLDHWLERCQLRFKYHWLSFFIRPVINFFITPSDSLLFDVSDSVLIVQSPVAPVVTSEHFF